MRCRRVLFYLSAYCRGELAGRRQRAVKEHLNACPDCRREEAMFWEINKTIRNLPESKVSDDFNSKLLDRIAKERFQETRTKAYLPKKAPVFGQGKLIPAFVSVGLVLAFVMFGGVDFMNSGDHSQNEYANVTTSSELDNSYATVQPGNSYVKPEQSEQSLAVHSQQAWTFKQKLAKANRMRALMNRLAGQNSFGSGYSHSPDDQLVPVSQRFILRRPVGNTQNRLVSGN
jgi:hypothetical protein